MKIRKFSFVLTPLLVVLAMLIGFAHQGKADGGGGETLYITSVPYTSGTTVYMAFTTTNYNYQYQLSGTAASTSSSTYPKWNFPIGDGDNLVVECTWNNAAGTNGAYVNWRMYHPTESGSSLTGAALVTNASNPIAVVFTLLNTSWDSRIYSGAAGAYSYTLSFSDSTFGLGVGGGSGDTWWVP
jgi:hypothetical protein